LRVRGQLVITRAYLVDGGKTLRVSLQSTVVGPGIRRGDCGHVVTLLTGHSIDRDMQAAVLDIRGHGATSEAGAGTDTVVQRGCGTAQPARISTRSAAQAAAARTAIPNAATRSRPCASATSTIARAGSTPRVSSWPTRREFIGTPPSRSGAPPGGPTPARKRRSRRTAPQPGGCRCSAAPGRAGQPGTPSRHSRYR